MCRWEYAGDVLAKCKNRGSVCYFPLSEMLYVSKQRAENRSKNEALRINNKNMIQRCTAEPSHWLTKVEVV